MVDNHVIIMAGGVGSRFWPISTPEYPKQFIDILGCGKSLLQLTVDRFDGICSPENMWVVTNSLYVDIVKEQVPDILSEHILAEPVGRNTAPCIAWACWRIREISRNANIVVTPSDAVIMNQIEFRRVILNSLDFTAENEVIVTLGMKPTRPETGYGYVEISTVINENINIVKAFKEKPDILKAQEYFESGNYLWNAGIFIWNINTIVRCISKYRPNIAAYMDAIISSGDVDGIFPLCEKISIDYAVLEPAAEDNKVYTHPAEFGWSDLGNWASLQDKLERDGNGNAYVGNVKMIESSDCLVHVEGVKKVIIQGLEGYIVSEKNGCILVCKKSEEQRIKEFIAL